MNKKVMRALERLYGPEVRNGRLAICKEYDFSGRLVSENWQFEPVAQPSVYLGGSGREALRTIGQIESAQKPCMKEKKE